MGLIRQLLTGFRVDGDAEPGVIVKDDGTTWLVNADGSETQLPGGGGSQAVLSASVVLTSAQILGLAVTPVPLVPAPGVGKIAIPLQVIASLRFGTVAYQAGGEIVLITHGDTPENGQVFIAIQNSTLVNAAVSSLGGGNQYELFGGSGSLPEVGTVASLLENAALDLFADQGAFTTGDGTLAVTCLYSVLDI